MALPFYNQADQAIWESGDKFIPQEQYRLNYTPSTSIANAPNTGITNTQAAVPYIWPPQGGGGGGGGGGLGGKWGNLDMSKSKMFDENVYSRDMINMSPMQAVKEELTTPTASFKPGQVQGFYNPQLGMYQTLEGKNIKHLGIDIKPIFGSILESMGVGGKNKYFKHRLGSTEGTFTHGLDSGIDKIKEGWEKEKEKFKNIGVFKKWRENKAIKKEKRLQAEIAADNLKAAQDAAAATAGPTGPQWHTSKGGQDTPGASGQNVKSSSGDVYGGAAYGYNEAAEKSDYYAGGGRIGYRNGEFVDENINVEGPNFDFNENIEMAEGDDFILREEYDKYLFEMEELNLKPMSFEDFKAEAMMAEGQEDSFSDQGLASLV
jgi:hypothetical protein